MIKNGLREARVRDPWNPEKRAADLENRVLAEQVKKLKMMERIEELKQGRLFLAKIRKEDHFIKERERAKKKVKDQYYVEMKVRIQERSRSCGKFYGTRAAAVL